MIAEQQRLLRKMMAAHIGSGDAYALVDFPDHANVGDSAIWLGEEVLLREATGRGPDYVATWHDFDVDALRAACPTGTLFLHGGGNLGDIWPHHQALREQVLATVRDRPVVQLPQSAHWRDPAGVARFADLAAAHPDFTLYVRDQASLDLLADRCVGPIRLAPDAAFALGSQPRAEATLPLLLLLRTDGERRDHGGEAPADATALDWLDDDGDLPAGSDPAARNAQARARVARGLALLSRGERFVTDRLHGHILASLLGIPHAVLDNDYGKIARYAATWSTGAHATATLPEAVAIARALPAA